MTAADALTLCMERSVLVWVEGDALHARPARSLSDALTEALREHKPEIRRVLTLSLPDLRREPLPVQAAVLWHRATRGAQLLWELERRDETGAEYQRLFARWQPFEAEVRVVGRALAEQRSATA